MSVQPNPTSGSIEVRLGRHVSGTAIIRNVLGQEMQRVLVQNAENFQIDLEGPKGIYFIDLKTEEGDYSIIKVVKQ